MKKVRLGHTSMELSAIVYGGWQAGKEYWVGIDDDEQIAAHRAAFDAGVCTFDTAEAYGEGHSEQILQKALGSKRDQIVIATKVSWEHLRHDAVIRACERSLKNLGTEWIDLYQIHWPAGAFGSEIVPIGETMGALLELKAQGKIRAIGVSNFNRAQLEEALRFGRVESVQPCHSLFYRPSEAELFPFCAEQGITVLAYSPLAQGLLTGKFGKGHSFPREDNRVDNRLFKGEVYERALSALEALRPIAQKNGISLAHLALAWLLARPNTAAIVGARNEKQARENAQASQVSLSKADWEEVDRIGSAVFQSLGPGSMMWDW